MEYINGLTLEQAQPTLTPEEKSQSLSQLKTILYDMRAIEPPGFLGSLSHCPYEDGVSNKPETHPPISGPFSSEEEFYAAMVRRFERKEPEAYVRLLRTLATKMPRHKVVLTHADLQPKNIMLQQTGVENGVRKYRLVLIDWEFSGWFPAYWEFCNATIAGGFKSEGAGHLSCD